jgi:hypothetical protein
LNFNKTLSKVDTSSKKVPWSFSADGYLKSGDSVLIMNKKTNGHLVMDIGTRASGLEEAYQLTSTPQYPGPMTRSVFVIKREEKIDVFGSDDTIRYGQKVRIESNS